MKKFLLSVEQAFLEWQNIGYCQDARNLNLSIGEEYFCITNPHFFTGNLNAELVLVHLNPKRKKDTVSKSYALTKPMDNGFNTFKDYLFYYQNFGKINYGLNSSRKHKSPFDHKQIRFLQPLNVLPFSKNDVYYNLETVIDSKLQIELIPFGSNNFNYKKIGVNNIIPFIDRILNLIIGSERKYVIFCGAVFNEILTPYTIDKKKHTFKLKKKDGSFTVSTFELINLKLQINNRIIDCTVAPQFAKQGYPVNEYGKKISELYGIYK